MPVIYIDVLLALNLFIDFLLLNAVSKILRMPPKRFRMVFGAIIGSASSCILFLPDLPVPLSLLVKFLAACLIVRVSFLWRNPLLYIKQIAVFIITSAVFGGLAFAIWFFAAPSGFYVINGVVYYNVSPLVLTVLTILCYFALSIYDRLTHKRMAFGQEFKIIVDGETGSAGLRTLYDTGHHVTDVFSGSPVAIVSYGAIESIISESLRDSILQALDNNNSLNSKIATALCCKLRMIPYHTVAGTGLLPAFCPKHITLTDQKGRYTDISGSYVAVCRVLGRGEYDAIIGTDMVSLLERSRVICLN